MRNKMYLLLAALLLCSIQLQAQVIVNVNPEQRVNGIVATFSSFAEGRATAEGIFRFNGSNDEENEVGSFLLNPSTGMYIGYTMVIERLPEPNKLKITIKPMPKLFDDEGEKTRFEKSLELIRPSKRGYTLSSPPSYPEPIVINITDMIKIPLWVNAGTEWGVIGDQIRFAFAKDRPIPARDFTLDDIAFKLENFRLIINGEVRSGEGDDLDLEDPLPSFYVPGKGLFILSLRPREGHNFQKIGVAEGKKISFSYGGDKYEWVSSEPVLAQGGIWHIWVLLETGYQPNPNLVELQKMRSKGNCCVFARADLDYYNKPPPSKK